MDMTEMGSVNAMDFVSSFTLFFLVPRATFNGDIQSLDKYRVFNNTVPY